MQIKKLFFIASQVVLFYLVFATGGILMAQDNQNNKQTTFDYKNQPPEFWKPHLSPEVYSV